MKRVLITGGSGFLGGRLLQILGADYEVIGTYSSRPQKHLEQLDVTNKEQVDKFFAKENPAIVIHAAAISDPDFCEENKELAKKANVLGSKHIVDACRTHGAKLVYISTDYVFDGEKGNYNESDVPNPVNFYGYTKVKAEEKVAMLDNSLILRFDILYGFNGSNDRSGFFSKIISGGSEVNNDQKRQPLLVDDVAHAITTLIEKNCSGVFHLGGPQNMTKYELGLELEKIIREDSLMIPIPEKKQIARRPKDVSLDVSKARSVGISFSTVSKGVEIIRSQYSAQRRDD